MATKPDMPAGHPLPIHPLVAGLAAFKEPGDLANAIEQTKIALDPLDDDEDDTPPEEKQERRKLARQTIFQAAETLGRATKRAEMIIFNGYLGGQTWDDKSQSWFQVLYVDAVLSSWVLIPLGNIRLHDRGTDDDAPFGLRDTVWVDADAGVVHGDAMTSTGAAFLSGAFTRAGDVSVSFGGDTYTFSRGLECNSKTPTCCTKRSK